MLAQNFMTADELGVTEDQRRALVAVLGLLERGEVTHVRDVASSPRLGGHLFNMNSWRTSETCGTVCCIAGLAEDACGVNFTWCATRDARDLYTESPLVPHLQLRRLFYPPPTSRWDYDKYSPDDAARALRAYLTTGRADWSTA